jgi:hypothetical protein
LLGHDDVMESAIRAAARRLQDWFAVSRSRPLPRSRFIPRTSGMLEGGPSAIDASASGNCDRNEPLPFGPSGIDVFDPCLAQRGITESTARTFGIGFFPGHGP